MDKILIDMFGKELHPGQIFLYSGSAKIYAGMIFCKTKNNNIRAYLPWYDYKAPIDEISFLKQKRIFLSTITKIHNMIVLTDYSCLPKNLTDHLIEAYNKFGEKYARNS